ncbi:MAG TPA: ribonuclease P protein component [Clostridia bacterium]|nr:ribonuclease P protein component [Clostridia bacterium]
MNSYLPIKENKDFRRIYNRGKSYVSPVLVTYVLKNRNNTVRIGITTSKKTGNAVKRSRARRVIREAFRTMERSVKPGYDFIFVARGKTPFVKSTDVCRAMTAQLKNAGVLE